MNIVKFEGSISGNENENVCYFSTFECFMNNMK